MKRKELPPSIDGVESTGAVSWGSNHMNSREEYVPRGLMAPDRMLAGRLRVVIDSVPMSRG